MSRSRTSNFFRVSLFLGNQTIHYQRQDQWYRTFPLHWVTNCLQCSYVNRIRTPNRQFKIILKWNSKSHQVFFGLNLQPIFTSTRSNKELSFIPSFSKSAVYFYWRSSIQTSKGRLKFSQKHLWSKIQNWLLKKNWRTPLQFSYITLLSASSSKRWLL